MIEEEHIRKFYAKLEKMQQGDILVLAGSVPKGMSGTSYRDMLEWISGKGILCVVDATGEALLNVLPYHPFLIKPNHHELGDIFGVEINDKEEAVPYAKKLQEMGARNVLVSLAGKGAVLAAENGEVYLEEAPKGQLVNAVGAGDSMVAGFLAGWLEDSAKYRHAFKMAIASGSASAFSAGFAEREEVMRLYAGFPGKEVENRNEVVEI